MTRNKNWKNDQRGATLVEFAIAATVFLTVMFAVIEFGRALWVHNALADAARRGARYAVVSSIGSDAAIKNVVVYGDPNGGTKPVVHNLSTTNVIVTRSGFALGNGTATVSITNYQFQFVIPIVSTSIQMPNYSTTLTVESAGYVPQNL